MPLLEVVVARASIPRENASIRRAQLRSLASQFTLLYVALLSNTVSLAFHFGNAPLWLTAGLPAPLVPFAILRIRQWRRLDVDQLDDRGVTQHLRKATLIVSAVAAIFTLWSFALWPYAADEEVLADIVFFLAIMIVATMFCLVHLRFAAPLLVALVVAPTAGALLARGCRLTSTIAMDILVISVVMAINASRYYRDFRRLNHALEDLATLSRANERAARIDSLTGIGNRREFFRVLDAAVEAHATVDAGDSLVVGLIDLDGFKPVNDLHGHAAGDALLAIVANRLRDALPPTAVCARLGGDEFAFLVPDMSERAAETLGRAVCLAIAAPMDLAAAQVRVEASLGLALHPAMGRTRDQLIEHADFALYHAKARSRGRPVLFSAEHADRIRAERLMKHALRWADFERELSLVFQPIVDVVANRVTSFEALARWTSPTLGRVSPADFIPLAERLGLVEAITSVLFAKACAVAQAWPETIRLSFNLSGEDLAGADAVARLSRMVDAAGLAPDRLIFEVTETAVIQDFGSASACLQALRDLGCRVALDDFGTGFSSLSYVHSLPLDKLKIDGSFVRALADDRGSRSIVQSIIDLCAKLGIDCVVEGVETQAQADAVHAMGCVVMQGWLFGTPIAEADMRRGDFPVAAYARSGRRAGIYPSSTMPVAS